MKKTTRISFTLWACLCMATYSFAFSACKTQENDSFDYSSSSPNTHDNSIDMENSSVPNLPDTSPSKPNEGEDTPIFSEQLKGLDIRDCWDFHDGLATIRYLNGGTSHYALINTKGEILATNTEHQTRFTTIGKGYAFHKVNDSFILLNEKGKKIAEFNEFTEILASQDGLALVDNVVESITGTKHFVGILDYTGKWLYPLTKVSSKDHHYAGNGVFMIDTSQGYLHFNTKTGNSTYFQEISYKGSHNGFVFVQKITSYINEIALIQKTIIPAMKDDAYYTISPDGSYIEVSITESELENANITDNKIIFFKDTHIEILDFCNNKSIIYDDYRRTLINRISFHESIGIVELRRTDGMNFFTTINEDGVELFAPIKYADYGNHHPCYAEGLIIYQSGTQKYSICDLQGNVTPITAAHHNERYSSDGCFHNGYAVFEYISNSIGYPFYINTKGERVLF